MNDRAKRRLLRQTLFFRVGRIDMIETPCRERPSLLLVAQLVECLLWHAATLAWSGWRLCSCAACMRAYEYAQKQKTSMNTAPL
eukprot:6184301-Pleurochrysis_carterae.AAC.2